MGIRLDRVKKELMRELSIILQKDLKDPRIAFVTITRLDLTGDLRNAKIYYSILGEDINKEEVITGIESAAGYVRKLVGERLSLKYVPELLFIFDKSLEYSINLEKTFERIKNEHSEDKDNN